MRGSILTNKRWSILKNKLLEAGVYRKKNLRRTVEGILFKLKSGCPWRCVPKEYGNGKALHKRFTDWVKSGKLQSVFDSYLEHCDLGNVSIDATIVKAHQHSSGARKGEEAAIGKSVGGHTTKVSMVADTKARPVDFVVTEGQVHDSVMAEELIENLPQAGNVIADKGYDDDKIREITKDNGGNPVIPRRCNSSKENKSFCKETYKLRHKVENLFARLKHFRSIATRYEKLKRNYEGMLLLGCIVVWSSTLCPATQGSC